MVKEERNRQETENKRMDVEANNAGSGQDRPTRRRERPVAARVSDFESWDYQNLSLHAGKLYRATLWVAGIYAAGGTGYLMCFQPAYALAFMWISFAALACLALWNSQGRRGLPAFPLLAAQLAFLNSIPLLTGADTLNGLAASTIRVSALTVALFLAILAGGWWLGVRTMQGRPSVWNLTPGGNVLASGLGLDAALPLLLFGLMFQVGNASGILAKLLPAPLIGFMPVFSAFAGAASMLGAFLGALAVANHPLRAGTLAFWAILTVTFFITIAGTLLSGACGIVFACAIGLGFGARRIPWAFLLTTILLVCFLNEGKAVMRGRYWNREAGAPQIGLIQLPEFYVEWADASLSVFQTGLVNDDSAAGTSNDYSSGGMMKRLDNFQNLTFIVDMFEHGAAQPLYGKTYTLIPPLLMPRILWPDKPRTHEGQILLNLNFGRQATEEETFGTYIAWGLLPEAVGNFGCVAGACFLGLLAGFGCGLLESWSVRKRLFSVEGLIAAALLVQLANSYEMVASVLVTSTFQLLVAVVTFGLLLRSWFMNSQTPRRRRRTGQPNHRQQNNQTSNPQDDKPSPVVIGR